jgi:hypothetical protein
MGTCLWLWGNQPLRIWKKKEALTIVQVRSSRGSRRHSSFWSSTAIQRFPNTLQALAPQPPDLPSTEYSTGTRFSAAWRSQFRILYRHSLLSRLTFPVQNTLQALASQPSDLPSSEYSTGTRFSAVWPSQFRIFYRLSFSAAWPSQFGIPYSLSLAAICEPIV